MSNSVWNDDDVCINLRNYVPTSKDDQKLPWKITGIRDEIKLNFDISD